jgi:ABC-2 type transport system permease protein
MSFAAFFKKEIMETYKTPKAIILGALFLFFGILSPLTAKYMNQILAMAGEQQGFSIVLPDSTFVQSYMQFFKNIYFMMTVVTILVFAGTVAEEKSRGTAVLVLTKCLSRSGFIMGKLIAAVLVFTAAYALSTAICIYYTSLMFPEFINAGILTALLLYWIFGCLMIALTILVSILSKSMTVAAVSGFGCYALISAVAALPYVGKYTPGMLQVLSTELSDGTKLPSDALIPALITAAMILVAVVAGLAAFRRQEL